MLIGSAGAGAGAGAGTMAGWWSRAGGRPRRRPRRRRRPAPRRRAAIADNPFLLATTACRTMVRINATLPSLQHMH